MLVLEHHIGLVRRLLVRRHFGLACFLALLRLLSLLLMRRLLMMVLVFEEGFSGDARHDKVVLMLLLAAERPRALVEQTLHATLVLLLHRLLLLAALLLLEGHDLLDLVLHLHDGVHHGHLCRRSLLLMRRQAHLNELQLLPQQLILLNQSLTVLRLVALI